MIVHSLPKNFTRLIIEENNTSAAVFDCPSPPTVDVSLASLGQSNTAADVSLSRVERTLRRTCP